jgi:hypothetical protein
MFNWGASDDAYLLPDTSGTDLLPSNTTVFCSTVRFGLLWHLVASTAAIFFVLFLGISQSGGVASPSMFLALAIALP